MGNLGARMLLASSQELRSIHNAFAEFRVLEGKISSKHGTGCPSGPSFARYRISSVDNLGMPDGSPSAAREHRAPIPRQTARGFRPLLSRVSSRSVFDSLGDPPHD